MKERQRHLQEQIMDAELARQTLAASMIEPKWGAREARRMFRWVARRMRRELKAATPELVGTEAIVCERLRIAIYAALTDAASRSPWSPRQRGARC